ncbi:MAG: ABC transporter permease, partial [Acidobacteriaceae bacterium]|nr:ABC transporter permease [Acidobacteriaceae bacterium]
MFTHPLVAMVLKDLRLFFTDRRSVIVSFVMPIAIASFFGSIFSGVQDRDNNETARVPIALVDEDASVVSTRIADAVAADPSFKVTRPSVDAAREAVRKGAVSVAVVIPQGFGDAASRAFFAGRNRPELTLWYDPSKAMELALVRGVLTEHVMESVSREVFSGEGGMRSLDAALASIDMFAMSPEQKALLTNMLTSVRAFAQRQQTSPGSQNAPGVGGISVPYTVSAQAMTSSGAPYNGYAHAFAGMGVQFLLFAMINLGIEVLLERQRGLWKRLRSAPISRLTLLGSKALSGSIVAMITLLVSFVFAMVVFKVRISGSFIGFLAIVFASGAMASSFGLLIAALGKTPGSARGIAGFATLMMVMLGGAWVP